MTKKLKMIAAKDVDAPFNATFASCSDMPIPKSASSVGVMIETPVPKMLNRMYFAEPGAYGRLLRPPRSSESDASCQMDA